MTGFRFIPEDWQLSDKLRDWTHSKGISDSQIEDMLEDFKNHQFKRVMYRPDACWMNWVKNSIRWGQVVPTVQRELRRPDEISEEQRKADAAKAWAEMNRLRGVK